MLILTIVLAFLALYLSAYVAYQLMLFGAAILIPDPADISPARTRRFNVVVPAHNEELHIGRLLRSLYAMHYPPEAFRVTVIADSCTDGTVQECRVFDVDVFERSDPKLRGKGHAIRFALERIRLDDFDAIVIVDADSLVDEDFLRQLNVQMERGDSVIQTYNGVANPDQSWLTRLLNVSRTIANEILHPGKRKLGLSSHLMGNGMCFEVAILKTRQWDAFSVGEDWEYYARLVLDSVVIGYSKLARVYHQESINLRQAAPQRLRWSSGRLDVMRLYGPSLLMEGLRRHNWKYLDASLPLIFPNPSLGMNLTLVGGALSAAHWYGTGDNRILQWYLLLSALQLLMFLVGACHTKNKLMSVASLVVAPIFLAWKMAIDILSAFGAGRKEWKATERRLS